jgi:hypothetical protein
MNSSRWRARIQQTVALILLSYAAADLFVPGICRTDDMPALNSAATINAAHDAEIPGSENSYFDDCFCCCPHIALPLLPRNESIFAGEQLSILKSSRLLDGVQLRPFNPPRINQV